MWQLPDPLVEAVIDVAATLGLPPNWLNAGAVGVLDGRLPDGFVERLRTRRYASLVVSILSRVDLLRLKLLAAADEGPYSRHVADVLGMRASRDEIAAAFSWVRQRAPADAHLLDDMVAILGLDDGD